MTKTCVGLSGSRVSSSYVAPEVTVVTIYPEGLLCQSGGVFSADHDPFAEDEGNPEDLW